METSMILEYCDGGSLEHAISEEAFTNDMVRAEPRLWPSLLSPQY